jgi:hypothetical protein
MAKEQRPQPCPECGGSGEMRYPVRTEETNWKSGKKEIVQARDSCTCTVREVTSVACKASRRPDVEPVTVVDVRVGARRLSDSLSVS